MDTIFSGIAVIVGILCIYIVINDVSVFEYEYRNSCGYIIFHFLGVFLLIISFVEAVMFFGDFKTFIFFDNIGVCLQMLLLGYASMGQSEKYYLREYSRRNNMNLDVKRIKEINNVQVSIIVVILICFWL